MAPANRDYMPDSEDDEQQVLIKNLQDQLTKCLDASNPREQLIKVLEKAAILQDLFDLHFRDEEGFTLLGNAVRWHLMDVVKFLVEVKNFKVKEELVIAVEADYRECVEYLIEVRPMLLDRKILAGTTCRPGMTPVMKASLMENESMLKLLFAKGAKPLEIPEYNPREPNNIIRFDAIYRTLVAISKPMYLCVMNEDPVMMAFKIAETCEKIAATLDVAKDDLLEVKDNCEKFASDFIKHADTFEHLELLLSQMTTEDINVVAPGNFLERLKYAMIHNHMDFVANRSVQKLVKKKFYDGPVSIKDFEGANMIKRSLYLSGLVMLTPIWLFLYLIYPASDTPTGKFVKAWMEMPIMRFIVNTVIYVVVGALFVSGGANYALFPLDEFPVAEGVLCLRTTVNLGDYKCLDNNHAFTPEQKELFRDPVEFNNYLSSVAFEFYSETFTNTSYILFADMTTVAWTFGNVYKEFWTIWSDGASTYFSDWVNYLNFLLNICFICGLSLRYSFIINMGYTPRDLFGDEFYHPMQVSEALKALGVLLVFYKLYKLLRVTQIIGRQQVLLVEALKSSLTLLLLFFIMAVSFSVASNGVLWRTYRDYIKNCKLQPDGSYSITVDINIPCPTNLVPSSLDELVKYQNFIQVFETYFFGMFNGQAYILNIFPSYENAQEWTALVLYSFYVFFMVIVRLNMITSLVVFSVMTSTKTEAEQFKFGRANMMYLFLQGSDPLPSPFNLVPSIYRISAWKNSRRDPKSKMFSEAELYSVPKIRNVIKSCKLNYLREKKLTNLAKQLGAAEVEKFGCKIREQLSHVDNTTLSVDRRTRQLLMNKKGAIGGQSDNENMFTKKYNQMKNRKTSLFASRAIGESTGGPAKKLTSLFK